MHKTLIAAAALIAAATITGTAAADTKWRDFGNGNTIDCSIARPGHSEAGICFTYTGTYDGWSFIVSPYMVEVYNAHDRVVYKHKGTGEGFVPHINWAKWRYLNEGTACNTYGDVATCIVRRGDLVGWAVLIHTGGVRVLDLDGHVRYTRGYFPS